MLLKMFIQQFSAPTGKTSPLTMKRSKCSYWKRTRFGKKIHNIESKKKSEGRVERFYSIIPNEV